MQEANKPSSIPEAADHEEVISEIYDSYETSAWKHAT